MISYWSMPVWLSAWKLVGVFSDFKSLQPSMFTPTRNSLYCSGGDDSHDDLKLNYTLCTVVGTIWCDKSCWHSNCSPALNKSEKIEVEIDHLRFRNWLVSAWGAAHVIRCWMQFRFSGICLSLSCAINSVCIPPISTVFKWTLHVPVEMYPLQLPLFSWICMHTVSHIKTKYVGLHFVHPHWDVMHNAHTYKQTCNGTCSCPAGRCQTPGGRKANSDSSQVFSFFFVSGRDVRGKLREWVSTEQHGPDKHKVMEESCSDVRVCILTENVFLRDTHVWFLWLDKYTFCQKKKHKKRKKK